MSSFTSPLKQQLLAEQAAKEAKPLETAFEEMLDAIKKVEGATIIKSGDRYILAEFKEEGFGGGVDDVEFLFSLDLPIVGYRSSPRKGSDDKRQRTRLRPRHADADGGQGVQARDGLNASPLGCQRDGARGVFGGGSTIIVL